MVRVVSGGIRPGIISGRCGDMAFKVYFGIMHIHNCQMLCLVYPYLGFFDIQLCRHNCGLLNVWKVLGPYIDLQFVNTNHGRMHQCSNQMTFTSANYYFWPLVLVPKRTAIQMGTW